MKIAVGSDEKTYLTEIVVEELKKRGHKVKLFGPLAGVEIEWLDVAEQVANAVSSKECEEGVLFCWTGTGVTIAANKVPGIRASLCTDAETTRGARMWNLSNILVMSLRLVSEQVAREILDAWFSTEFDESERHNINKLIAMERKYLK